MILLTSLSVLTGAAGAAAQRPRQTEVAIREE